VINTGSAVVENGNRAGGGGQELATYNIDLQFSLPTPSDGFTLLYEESGGSVNLAINGDLRTATDMVDLNGATIGGTQVAVTTNALGVSQIEVLGTVNTFIVGGQEFRIDYLCVFLPGQGDGSGVHVVNLGTGEERFGLDFGNYRPGEIHGSKWSDLDGDGQRDPNEPGLPGWTIYIDANNDGRRTSDEPFEITDENGEYWFKGLPAGTHTVAEEDQPGWTQTFPSGNPAVELYDVTFSSPIHTVGSPPTTGAGPATRLTPTRILQSPPIVIGGLGTLVQPVEFTNSDSQLQFNLNDFGQTFTSLDISAEIFIEALDFGREGSEAFYLQLDGGPALAGFVRFEGNGSIDVFEPNMGTITAGSYQTANAMSLNVNLDLAGGTWTVLLDGSVLHTGLFTTSTLDGFRLFLDDIFGQNSLVVVDDVRVIGSSGGQDGTHRVPVNPGDIVTGIDFGNRPDPGEIHGTKFEDFNGNGVRDPNEPPLAGWTIYIDGNDNGELDEGEQSMVTGSTGLYWFTELPPGRHTVREVAPAGSEWFQTSPFISFTGPTDYDAGLGPEAIATEDMNGDGLLDLVVANLADDTISVLPGMGGGLFGLSTEYPVGDAPSSVVVADFTGNGLPRVAVSNRNDGTITVYDQLPANPGVLVFVDSFFTAGTGTESLAVGDFDQNGAMDLAVALANEDSVEVFYNEGGGVFSLSNLWIVGPRAASIVSADFNHDDAMDLAVVTSGNSTLTVFMNRNDAGGTFDLFTFGLVAVPTTLDIQLIADDFDQNGDIGLAFVEPGLSAVQVLLSQGAVSDPLTFAIATLLFVPGTPNSLAAADFDGNEYPDLVATLDATDEIAVLLNNGDGTYRQPVRYDTGLRPTAVVAGDFSDDGAPDIAVTNIGLNTVSVYLRGALDGHTVDLDGGVIVTGRDFGNFRAGRIEGTKFNDLDCFGDFDANEPGLGGVTIYVDLNDNGEFDAGEPSDVTDANGDYSISGVQPGTHKVREVVPDDFAPSFPPGGSHDVTISFSGQVVTGRDFGNFQHTPLPDGSDNLFGYNASDAIYGDNLVTDPCVLSIGDDDHLFGLEGDDMLVGQLKDDTYYFGPATADETDTIVELAGEGTEERTDEGIRDRLDYDGHDLFGDGVLEIDGLGDMEPVVVDLSGSPPAVWVANQIAEHIDPGGTNTHVLITDQPDQHAHIEQMIGGEGDDILIGNDGDNLIDGGLGSDFMQGGAGDDTYRFLEGNPTDEDTLVETIGSDTLDFSRVDVPVTADLSGTNGGWPADRVAEYGSTTLETPLAHLFENIIGGSDSDVIIGNDAANILDGGPSSDEIHGLKGDDTLIGGTESDTFFFADDWGTDEVQEDSSGGVLDTMDFSQVTVPLTHQLGSITSTAGVNIVIHADEHVEQLIGGSASDTLAGPDADTTWNITDNDAGNVDGSLLFESIENLTGADGFDDTFVFSDGKGLSGAIDGGVGGSVDGVDYSLYTTAVTVNINDGTVPNVTGGLADIENVIGSSAANDVLIGPDSNNTWSITDNDAGDINGVIFFQDVENLTGPDNFDDTFIISDTRIVTGTIDGGGGTGTDTLDFSPYQTPVAVDLSANVATNIGAFTELERHLGSTNDDSLTGPDANNTWNVTGDDAGDIDGAVSFESFENLLGRDNFDDSFVLSDGQSISGSIDGAGGTGTDTIDFSLFSTSVTANLADGTASNTGAVSDVENLIGGLASDTLVGPDSSNTWNITENDEGDINGSVQFTSFENLTGRDDFHDTFVIADSKSLSGALDGGVGTATDSLDLSVYTTAVTVSLGDATATGVTGGISNLEAAVGGSDSDTLVGPDVNSTWNITDDDEGNVNGSFVFSGFESLNGRDNVDDMFVLFDAKGVTGKIAGGAGTGTDTLDYSLYTNSVTVNVADGTATNVAAGIDELESATGSSAIDTLVGPDANSIWNVTGNDAGDIDTAFTFSSFENLTGRDNFDDSIVFGDGMGVTGAIDGGAGTGSDTLDFSAYTTDVMVDLANGTATNIAGGFTEIAALAGGAGTDSLVGPDANTTWNITDTDVGDLNGAVTFSSFENLTGHNNFDDLFIISDAKGVSGAINGGTGTGTDTIDYSTYTTSVSLNLEDGTSTNVSGGATGIEIFAGGADSDTLTDPNTVNIWSLTADDGGDVNGAVQFSSVENLTGGTDDDEFVFSDAVGVAGTIDGGDSFDTLDYTAYTSVVSVDLIGMTATGTGGIASIEHWIDENGTQQALTSGGVIVPADEESPSFASRATRRSFSTEPTSSVPLASEPNGADPEFALVELLYAVDQVTDDDEWESGVDEAMLEEDDVWTL